MWCQIWELKSFGDVKKSSKKHFHERADMLAKKAANESKKEEVDQKNKKKEEIKEEENKLIEKFMLLSLE